MCNKLIVLSVVLVVAGFCVPAPAAYIGFDDSGNSGVNPLKVDINGEKPGWQSWYISPTWTGPISQTFINPYADGPYQEPTATLEVYRKNQGTNSNVGASRTREGGWAGVLGTGDFSPTTEGFGMNYIKLTVSGLSPSTAYKFWVWDFETVGTWVLDTSNPDRKFIAWSQANPKNWLDAQAGKYLGIGDGTHDPNGYGPKKGDQYPGPTTDSNMPGTATNPYSGPGQSLWQQVLGRVDATAPDKNLGWDELGTHNDEALLRTTTDSGGNVVLYAWMDGTDWGNSMHVALNGFEVIPEPATIALFGLGVLGLLRKRRA